MSRHNLTLCDFLGETLSSLGAIFAQAEEHARQSIHRAGLAAATLTEEVSQMQAQAEEHLAGTSSHMADAEKARAEARELLTGADFVCRRLRALKAEASAAVDTWIEALEQARLQLHSGRVEMSQAQNALAGAKALVGARDSEHTAAAQRAVRDGALKSGAAAPSGQPLAAARLEEAVAAREHARTQLRFAIEYLKAAQQKVADAQRMQTRCQGGLERAIELARAAGESAQRASGALALAQESATLAGAAVTQLLRSQPAAEASARNTREAAAAAAAVSEELTRPAALARAVSDSQAQRHALHRRGVVALEDVRGELLQLGALPGS